MYIGNIDWKHCSLETSFALGNIKCILETYIGYWKQKKDIGNIKKRLETYSGYWKHHFSLETHIYWKHISYMFPIYDIWIRIRVKN